MRVLVVSGYYIGRGGAGIAIWNWIKNLPQYGIKVDLVSCGISSKLNVPKGVKHYDISCNKYNKPYMSQLYKIKLLKSIINGIIERKKFDLIHAHSPLGSILSDQKIPIITTFHYGPVRYNNINYPLRYASLIENIRKWSFLYEDILQLQELKNSNVLTCQTEDMINSFVRCYGIKKERFYVLPLAVDIKNTVNILTNKKNEEELRIVGISLNWLKGLPTLLHALNELSLKNIKVTLIGGGYYSLFLSLKYAERRLLKKFLSTKKIQIIPHLDHKLFLSILPTYDLFITPHYIEGYSLSSLEAGSLGVPVIVGNNRTKSIQISSDGFLYINPFEGKYLANALEMLYYDKELRYELSEKLKETVKQKFSVEKIAKHLAWIYNNV